jgi:hypothetical protein
MIQFIPGDRQSSTFYNPGCDAIQTRWMGTPAPTNNLVCWDLFSGTGSVYRVARKRGFTVYDLEINADLVRNNAVTNGPGIYVGDIHTFDFSRFPQPHLIMESPPCTQYSITRRHEAMDLRQADENVVRLLNTLQQYPEAVGIIENPDTSLLWSRPYHNRLPLTKQWHHIACMGSSTERTHDSPLLYH